MRRALAAALGALLLTACGSGPADSPGAEATSVEEPTEETTGPEAAGQGGGDVAVELPGLPVGGGVLTFSAAEPTQCGLVNLTGEQVPESVEVSVSSFGMPDAFSVADGACGGFGACLGGEKLTASTICSVLLTWDGGDLPGGTGELSVAAASLDCPDEARCDEAVADIEASGAGTIELSVPESGDDGTGDDGTG